MKIIIEPHRSTIPIFYEEDGKKWCQFIHACNFPETVELPKGAKLIEVGVEDGNNGRAAEA